MSGRPMKDSGIEWIGEIPEHWETRRLKFLTNFMNGYSYSSNDWKENGAVVVRMSNFSKEGFLRLDDKYIKCITEESSKKTESYRLFSGDVLIAMTDMSSAMRILGKTIRFNEVGRFHLNQRVGCLRLNKYINRDFYYFASNTDIVRNQIKACVYVNVQCNASTEGILNSFLPLPPLSEQRAIATFLDRKTCQIDQVIEKKERLIKLLEEKRSALITQAVTRGLDPDVSSTTADPYTTAEGYINWLTNIPSSWEIVPSKTLFKESKERARSGDQQLSATQAYGVIFQADFERLVGRQVTHSFLHLEKRKHVEIDDFVISMRSFQGGLERSYETGCIRSSYVVLKPTERVYPSFFAYLFKSKSYIQALQATSNFIRDGQDLNWKNFTLVNLPLVPLDEQKSIANYLDKQVSWMDKVTEKVAPQIEKLKEYRQALITSAVTGKIDLSETQSKADTSTANPPEQLSLFDLPSTLTGDAP